MPKRPHPPLPSRLTRPSRPRRAPGQPAAQPYALISPSLASAIDSQSHTPLAGQFIHLADAHLADTPHPLPRLHTEGTLPHQGIHDQSIAAKRDFDTMLAFAFAYRLAGDNRYLDAESRFLTSWSKVYQPSLNPIDETRFDPVILAFDLTRANLPVATQQQVDALFRDMATGYLDWKAATPAKTSTTGTAIASSSPPSAPTSPETPP